jgi:hypothetical protein
LRGVTQLKVKSLKTFNMTQIYPKQILAASAAYTTLFTFILLRVIVVRDIQPECCGKLVTG